MIDLQALYQVSYGLYIVSSGSPDKGNAYISNTVFQVTSEPAKFATCCNKDNYTAGLIQSTGAFAVSVLKQEASAETIGRFGFKSGKDTDKLAGVTMKYGITGVPVVLDDCISYMEFRVLETIDEGSHLMFIGELVEAVVIDEDDAPLTYAYYRKAKNGVAPKNAPTYIDPSKFDGSKSEKTGKVYKCTVCGYLYEEANEDIAFSELDNDYICPICGAEKEDFIEI